MSLQTAPTRVPQTPRALERGIAIAAVLDLALVLVFAGIGRSSHSRSASITGLLETAWPFLTGVAIMWLLVRAWKHPLSIVHSGLPVWVGTVAIGVTLRAVTGAGIAPTFILVTAITLGVFLLGWRGIGALVLRLRGRTT